MYLPLNIAISGLKAQQKVLHDSAHNIVNAFTPKADLFVTTTQSAEPAGVVTQTSLVNAADVPQAQDLSSNLVTMMTAENAFKANAAVIRASDRLLGELLDITS